MKKHAALEILVSILFLTLILSFPISPTQGDTISSFGSWEINMTGIPEPIGTFEIEVDMWQEGDNRWTTTENLIGGKYRFDLSGIIINGILDAKIEVGDQVSAWLIGSARLVFTSQGAFEGPWRGTFDATEPYSRNREVEGMMYGQKTTTTQTLMISMKPASPTYEQGEAVTITGEVLYGNKPIPPEYWSNEKPPISRLNIRV